MKSLLFALSLLPLTLLAGGPGDDQTNRITVFEDSEIHIKVVLSYVGCTQSSAMYQVFEDGSSKIVDLKNLDKTNPYLTHSSNSRTVHRVLAEIGQCDFYIKSMESQEIDDCSYQMYYVLEDSSLRPAGITAQAE